MSAESLPADKLIGTVLADRYQVLHRLGEGAMGAVYKARHVKVGRTFAVKVLHSRLLQDAKVAQRFEREAELAGRLRHANVIGVVDVGEIDGLHYMVMDFAEGPDLAQLLGEAPMPPARILRLARQMLEGLYHAHERGLIHRDFKPENVIIERDSHGVETPRIVDFGIAILRDGGDSSDSQGRLTTNGLVLGTPHYMAPEQAVADPIDHRIDLFALGIVVYEMLCGQLPFDGSGAEVARANLLLDPPAIADRVPYLEVDPLLEAFARRMMAKKPKQRPATAKAARELLDLIERDRGAAAVALGIATEAGARAPAETEPLPQAFASDAVAPPRGPVYRAATPGPGVMTPPMAQTPVTAGPPMQAGYPVSAMPMTYSAPEYVAQQPSTPMAWMPTPAPAPRSRRPWIVAATTASTLGLAALVLAMTRSEPPSQPVAAPAPAASASAGSATPEVKAAPVPVAPAPIVPAPTAPAAALVVTEPAPAPTPAAPPAAKRVVPRTRPQIVEPKPTAVAAVKPAAVEPKTVEPAEVKPTTIEPRPTVADKPVEAKPAARKPAAPKFGKLVGLTGGELATLYQSVGSHLFNLPRAKVDDLIAQYTRLHIQTLFSAPQPERDAAAQQLQKMLDDAYAR